MQKRKALILGATGLIGSELIKILQQAPEYEEVRILVRRPYPKSTPKIKVHVVDYEHLEQCLDLFRVDDVFCCLGTTMKKAGSQEAFRKVDFQYPMEAAEFSREANVQQYLIVTALGADSQSGIFYNRVKGEVEDELKKLGFPALHIFQPSLLLGDRKEKRLGEKVGIIGYKLTQWMWVGPLRPYRGIHVRSVANAMYKQAISNQSGVHVIPSQKIQEMGG